VYVIGARSREIESFLLSNLKAAGCNQVVDLAIQMTPASNPLPDLCYAVLPRCHSGLC